MKKILHIITGLNNGGAERVLYNLLYGGLNKKFHNHIISLLDEGTYGKSIRELGIPVTSIHMKRNAPMPLALYRLITNIKQISPEIIQCHMYHANLLGGIAGKIAGNIPVVWAIHHTDLNPSTTKKMTLIVVRFGAILSFLLPEKIINCAKSAERIHIELGYDKKKMITISNGTDVAQFIKDTHRGGMIKKRLNIPENALLIGMVTRFHPQKDIKNFLNAASILVKTFANIFFILCGENINRKNTVLLRWIERLEIQNNILLLGRRKDIPQIMSSLDLYCSSSSSGEAFPMVLGEAMSCELPCVVTDVGDSAYIVGKTGIVVPPKDSNALAGGIKKLLQITPDERQALGNKARARIIDNFALPAIANEYIRLYDRILLK